MNNYELEMAVRYGNLEDMMEVAGITAEELNEDEE